MVAGVVLLLAALRAVQQIVNGQLGVLVADEVGLNALLLGEAEALELLNSPFQ